MVKLLRRHIKLNFAKLQNAYKLSPFEFRYVYRRKNDYSFDRRVFNRRFVISKG